MKIDSWISRMRFSEVFKLVQKLEKQKGHKLKILDLGGAGFVPGESFADKLREAGHSVVTGDIAGNPDIKLDMNKSLPFQDKSFDLVVSLAVVEHLDNWKLALKEMKRVGKAVIFTTPSPVAKKVLELLAKIKVIDSDQIADHRHYLTSDEIEEAGYQTYYFQFGLNQVGYIGLNLATTLPIIISLTIFFAVLMAVTGGIPPDDLLRHLVSHRYEYDWSVVYPYSDIPSFNLWIGFEVLAGWINKIFDGNGFDWKFFQSLCVVVNILGLFAITRRVRDIHVRVFFVLLVMALIWSRLSLGRPAEFLNGFMLLLWGLNDSLTRPWKVFLGTLTVPVYWLWWVYLVPLVLLDYIYIVVLALGAGFWFIYAGPAYLEFLQNLLASISSTSSTIMMTENVGLFPMLFSAAGFFLIALKAKDKRPLLAMFWFMIPNQIRYYESIISLSLASLKEQAWRMKSGMFACCLAIIFLFQANENQLNISGKEDLSVLEGHTILCCDMNIMFYLVNRLNRAKFIPSYNLYLDDSPVKQFFQTVLERRDICNALKDIQFDYLVDSSQIIKNPPCLKLVNLEGPFRIWQSQL